MKPALFLACLGIVFFGMSPIAHSVDDERDFFDGIEARNVGPFRGGRATVAVGVRENPHVYYMGTTGGVWKTDNAGASWYPVSDEDFGSSAVGAIAVAASDPNVVVVGMGESPFRNIASSQGDGVYKSTDAGKTWTHIGFEDLRQVGEIRIHPNDPDTIWVAAQGNTYAPADDGGVFKTTDGGKTWRRVLEPLNESSGAVDLAIDPGNPRILFAAMWDNQRSPWKLRSGGDGSGIWRSSDGGESWERLVDDLPEGMGKLGVAVSGAKSGRVWAVIEAEGDEGGLYRSDDGGDSWSQVNKERVLRARSWYYMHIFADPNDENTVYVLNAPFMKSIDGGKSFTQVNVPHGDNHYLWINPDNSDWMVNANDGGANVSFDGARSWSRQDNQPTAQFYRVNTDNAFEYRIYGGQQDNSTVAIRSRSRDGSIGRDDWEIHGGCESAYVAMDPDDPRYTYAGCYLGLIDEFDTQTRTSRSIKAYAETGLGQLASDSKYRFNWNAPIHVSLHDPKVLYHGGNVLLKSVNRGFDWAEASPDLTRNEADKQGQGSGPYTNENIEQYNTIFSFAESPHDADTLWVGSDDGLLHLTRDGGENWKDVTPRNVGRGLINSIEVSPHDPAVAYVVVMKYKEGDNKPYVYRTANYGRSWSSITDGLPDTHFARVLREDPERAGLLFVGMERGLYISFNSGKDWQAFQGNLPIVPITDLMLRRNDLVLATQGRAFWVIDDILPLRQFQPDQASTSAHLYAPSMAIRLTPTKGRSGGGESVAPSAPNGAVIYYALSEELDVEEQSLTLDVLNAQGDVVRRIETDAKKGVEGGGSGSSIALPAEKGLNRLVWDLRTDATQTLDYDVVYGSRADKSTAGYAIAPGTYTLRLQLAEESYEQSLEVSWDPINSYDGAAIEEQQAFVAEAFGMIDAVYTRVASLQSIQKQVQLRQSLAKEAGDDIVSEAAESLLSALGDWQESVTTPQRETFQDVLNFHPRIDAFLIDVYQQADNAVLGLTRGQRERLDDLRPQWQAAMSAWQELMDEDVAAFNAVAGPAVAAPDWE
ncbi:MAG: photosystem II stability/assembly factor-like uncharacterized protein [Glaciecola sp.]|jgi:photosystem II stability/assembly factor-like uncharacterized protein|uniref:WD40/YVTN/BNR-like repeat-containing protein n=1 Tax=Congregibacter sp. TaxID=2744308 RepID=UPI0039E4E13F